jgi:phospholipid transport system transporter-binding protein
MTQRKKATSAPPRPRRGGRLSRPSKTADVIRETALSGPSSASSTTLTLSAECLVSDTISLKERLAGLLDEPLVVTLDINTLQRIDTAAMQLITAFVRARADRGLAVEWQGAAPAFANAAQLLGLTSLLRLPA